MKIIYFKLLLSIISIALLSACSSDEPVPDDLSQDIEGSLIDKGITATQLLPSNPMVKDMNAKLYLSTNNSRVTQMLNESSLNWEWVLSIPINDSSTVISSVEIIPIYPTTTITNLVGIYQNDSLVDIYLQEFQPSNEYLTELVENSFISISKQQFLANFSGKLVQKELDGTIISEREVGTTSQSGRMLGDGIMLQEVVVSAKKVDYAFCRCTDTYTYAWEDYNDWISNVTYTGGGSSSNGTPNTPIVIDNVVPISLEEFMAELWEITKIDDSLLKPCMQTIMADLKNLTQGVGQIVTKFAGNVPGYNWEIKDGVLNNNQNASTSQQYNSSTGTVTTTFDSNKFGNASDLSVARTMLHETVHAYLVTFFKNDPLIASKSYAQLLQDYYQFEDANFAHHQEMARSFVNDLALALQEFGNNRGYNNSLQFYEDLAWGGLQGTTYFSSLSQTDKNRIIDVVLIELTGKDSNGNNQTQNGNNVEC